MYMDKHKQYSSIEAYEVAEIAKKKGLVLLEGDYKAASCDSDNTSDYKGYCLMELKNYQKQVMDDLSAYLNHLNQDGDMFDAWKGYWMDKDIPVGLGGVPAYKSAIPGVPHVCTKVPTGGGKTFMACADSLLCSWTSPRWWCGSCRRTPFSRRPSETCPTQITNIACGSIRTLPDGWAYIRKKCS